LLKLFLHSDLATLAVLALAILAAVGSIVAQPPPPVGGPSETGWAAKLLWYLSGDRGLLADQAMGDPAAYGIRSSRDGLRPGSVPGHKGAAIEVSGPGGAPATFKMRGNVNLSSCPPASRGS
jgi:hypothetical protein